MIGCLTPATLRQSPQCGPLELLRQASELATLALIAAHPSLEHHPACPIDVLADHVLAAADVLDEAVGRYCRLLAELDHLEQLDLDPEDEDIDDIIT